MIKSILKDSIMIIFLTVVLSFVSYSLGAAVAQAKTIKVAVIDTGFNWTYSNKVRLCPTGHRDFSGTGLHDTHGHGTHIAGLVAQHAKDADYCVIVLKYFAPNTNNLINTVKAIEWATSQGVDIINYSSVGIEPSELEKRSILRAILKGIIFVSAAGNEGKNLDQIPFYPASYDKRIVVVGNVNKYNKRVLSSNYGGPIDVYANGFNVQGINGIQTGTSQSTAIITGTIVKQLYTRQMLKHNYELNGIVSTDNYLFGYEKWMAQ